MYLALNNQQKLICHKTQPTNQQSGQYITKYAHYFRKFINIDMIKLDCTEFCYMSKNLPTNEPIKREASPIICHIHTHKTHTHMYACVCVCA